MKMSDNREAQSRAEALAESPQHKREREQEQAECPHDEHDHYICLDCGKDLLDDMITRSDLLRDE
jgi:hypothetical protein